MKMKSFTNGQFFLSWDKVFKGDLSPLEAYKAKKIADFLTDEFKKFNEIRTSIIEKYGDKDENGKLLIVNGELVIKPENQENVNMEAEQLQSIELDSPPHILDYNELCKCKKLELSGLDLALLEDLLDFRNVK